MRAHLTPPAISDAGHAVRPPRAMHQVEPRFPSLALRTPAAVLDLQRTAGNRAVQRVLAGPSATDVAAGGFAAPEVGEGIDATQGRGPHLETGLAQRAGDALGADLSGVRVHTDGDADLLSRSLGARAFTTGNDIYFRTGAYQPGTAGGRELIAHELTHVRQQRSGGEHHPQGKLEVGPASTPAEAEADQVAHQVADRLAGPAIEHPGTEHPGTEHPGTEHPGTEHLGAVPGTIPVPGVSHRIQRAIGFEFQTGWGLVRSLPAAPTHPVTNRANDPDPLNQADWEDVAINHPMAQGGTDVPAPTRALPPRRSWKDKLRGRNKAPNLGPSPTVDWGPGGVGNFGKHNDRWANPGHTQYMSRTASLISLPTANRVHYKFHKGQIIKDYGAYKMTVDDASTPLGAELEWVVDPPVADSAPLKTLQKIMTDLTKTAAKLVKFSARESFLLSEVTKDAADDHVELQPNVKGQSGATMQAAAQATGGVSIDKLLTLFSDLGSVGAPSTPNVARNEMKGGAYATTMAQAGNRITGSDRLKGVVAYIARYLEMGAATTPLSYAKVNTQFLARTDFASMFRLLPDPELGKYGGPTYLDKGGSATNPDDFVDLVLNDALEGRYAQDRKIFNGGVKDGAGGVTDIPLTIGDWLRGIADGKDLLSGKYWKTVANDVNSTATEVNEARGMHKELESMGNLGAKKDLVGNANVDKGIIMEFRSNTDPQPLASWKTYAMTIFRYLKELNRQP